MDTQDARDQAWAALNDYALALGHDDQDAQLEALREAGASMASALRAMLRATADDGAPTRREARDALDFIARQERADRVARDLGLAR